MSTPSPRGLPPVSIAIPAYHERFFGEALASARAQDYPALEIVVCDDSAGEAIERTARAANDSRIRYFRNPARLGFEGNFTECVRRSQGELVKLLNDDDRLRPGCVAALAAGFALDPRVTLATSRRAVIGERGEPLGDITATAPIAHVACVMAGTDLADFVLVNGLNLIGEPSTVMFRRRDVPIGSEGLFTWNGRSYHCLADLSLWIRLLARGFAFYQPVPLSEYRLHPGQEQRGAGMDVACLEERLELFRGARGAGLLANAAHARAALERIRKFVASWDGQPLEPAHRARLDALAAALSKETV